MKNKGGKNQGEDTPSMSRRRSVNGGSESDFAIGRTIAGASHRGHTMAVERQKIQKKQKRKSRAIMFLMLILAVTLILIIIGVVNEVDIRRANEKAEAERRAVTPTVAVFNENAGEGASVRQNEFIVRLEEDARENNLVIDHVVLPFQKAREIIVFLQDRNEYYKLSIDRGSAVQSEDMARMARFLDEKGIKCSYVDLRVEGRAYYK